MFGRPSFTLKTSSTRHTRRMEGGCSAARGHQLESHGDQFLAESADVALVAVVDADKHGPGTRQLLSRGKLRLGKGLPVGVEIPITSPVERISGPRMVSTPRNLLNGKTGDLTE